MYSTDIEHNPSLGSVSVLSAYVGPPLDRRIYDRRQNNIAIGSC